MKHCLVEPGFRCHSCEKKHESQTAFMTTAPGKQGSVAAWSISTWFLLIRSYRINLVYKGGRFGKFMTARDHSHITADSMTNSSLRPGFCNVSTASWGSTPTRSKKLPSTSSWLQCEDSCLLMVQVSLLFSSFLQSCEEFKTKPDLSLKTD